MTATETPPTAAAEAAPERSLAAMPAATDSTWLDTGDHLRVGRLFMATAALLTAVGLVLDVLVKLDRSDASGYVVLDDATWVQAFTASIDAVVLLGVLPFMLGLAIYVVPLQMGVGVIAFPRLAAMAYWTYLVSAGILLASYIIDGGPAGGDADGVELYLVSLGLVCVALCAASVSVASTVLGLRTPGLRLWNVPAFSWSALATASMALIALPAIAGLALLAWFDHRYDQPIFGDSDALVGLFDAMRIHPQILLVAIPALGIVVEIVQAATRSTQTDRTPAQTAISIFAVFTFGMWANNTLVNNVFIGPGVRDIRMELAYVAVTGIAALAALGAVGVALMSLRSGRPQISAALLTSLVAALMLLGGTALAALGSTLDWLVLDSDQTPLADTLWRDGTYALIVYGGGIGAMIAGWLWWAPKIYGRTAGGPLGWVGLLGIAGGVTLVAVPSLVAGAAWATEFGPIGDGDGSGEAMAAIAAVGSAIVLLGLLAVIADVVASQRSGDAAGDNPHGAHTLEWATGSPPPPGGFGELPDPTVLLADADTEEEA